MCTSGNIWTSVVDGFFLSLWFMIRSVVETYSCRRVTQFIVRLTQQKCHKFDFVWPNCISQCHHKDENPYALTLILRDNSHQIHLLKLDWLSGEWICFGQRIPFSRNYLKTCGQPEGLWFLGMRFEYLHYFMH